jgi:hypothetical protein
VLFFNCERPTRPHRTYCFCGIYGVFIMSIFMLFHANVLF